VHGAAAPDRWPVQLAIESHGHSRRREEGSDKSADQVRFLLQFEVMGVPRRRWRRPQSAVPRDGVAEEGRTRRPSIPEQEHAVGRGEEATAVRRDGETRPGVAYEAPPVGGGGGAATGSASSVTSSELKPARRSSLLHAHGAPRPGTCARARMETGCRRRARRGSAGWW
jgi:hypothetical protein